MLAFTKTITKPEFMAELRKHQAADAFLQGNYWDGKKGCAVGCSLKSLSDVKNLNLKYFNDHDAYEKHLGIPKELALLEDKLFEKISKERSKTWPVDFAEAIPHGADLRPVVAKFKIVLIEHAILSMEKTVYDPEKFPDVKAAIEASKAACLQMIEAHRLTDESAARSAARSAESAARSAESAARSAESAARSAKSAARSAESAAVSAAESARSAAESARSAAESARSAAESAAASAARSARSAAESAAESAAASAARSAAESAEKKAYEFYADKLLELLRSA